MDFTPSHMLDWLKNRLPLPSRQRTRVLRHHPARATVTSGDSLGIDRHRISDNALRTLRRLQESGYEAYIVGGGVRDLLLNLRPKDFDIATNATPEEVRQIFRHSRIIGRRFRIVHVLWGRETIEVTTFRGHHQNATHRSYGESSDKGLLLRDNVYGTLEEDALRRDFTVNALYYCADGKVRDFCGGLPDLQARLIRMIGDPEVRYREDPVRMLRAVRLAVKLDFQIEQHTAAPIARLAPLLHDISNARLFDEAVKLFMSGCARHTWEQLHAHGLFAVLFPLSARALTADSHAHALITQALTNTDERIRQGLRVTPAFLFAALLWPAVRTQQQQLEQQNGNTVPARQLLHQAAARVLGEQVKRIGIPKRFSVPMQEIWELQWQLPQRHGSRAERLLEHPRFRAAYDFLLLREHAGEMADGLGAWWTQYQQADATERQALVQALQPDSHRSNRKRHHRRRRGPRAPAPTAD